MPATHPVEPSSAAISMTASAKSRGWVANPPYSSGCSMRVTPLSRSTIAALVSNRPRASLTGADERICAAQRLIASHTCLAMALIVDKSFPALPVDLAQWDCFG